MTENSFNTKKISHLAIFPTLAELKKRFTSSAFLYLALFVVGVSCTEDEKLEDIGTNIAGPIAITTNADYGETASHFYVLNSDLDRRFNEGSILTLNTSGARVSAVTTPRLGLFLERSDDKLIAGFGPTDQYETNPQIIIYDISSPEKPVRAFQQFLDCLPVNAYAPSSYAHFAITCRSGDVFIGTWGTTIADTTIVKVRDPDAVARRAIYIDTVNEILYAFPSDWGKIDFNDNLYTDANSYDENFVATAVPNEVPDTYEDSEETKILADKQDLGSRYKFLVYDIATERENGFPLLASDEGTAALEMRWIYFNNSRANTEIAENVKYYRTNFWHIEPDPQNANAFYISQRGDETSSVSPDANAVYRFTIDPAAVLPTNGTVPETSTFLTVETVFGYTQDTLAAKRYTSFFTLAEVGGEQLFVVSDFRDASIGRAEYFETNAYSLSFFASTSNWTDELSSNNRAASYYAVAAAGNTILAGSYFSDSLILVEVSPGSDINIITTIE